tara:strand:+ start:1046 stop:1216 length:171 start_codon:yes stop_codon:yes gene_type:complete
MWHSLRFCQEWSKTPSNFINEIYDLIITPSKLSKNYPKIIEKLPKNYPKIIILGKF